MESAHLDAKTADLSSKSALLKGFGRYVAITTRVFSTTLACIALLTMPAYYLDLYFGTTPWLFLLALAASLPLSLYMVFRVMNSFLSTRFKT